MSKRKLLELAVWTLVVSLILSLALTSHDLLSNESTKFKLLMATELRKFYSGPPSLWFGRRHSRLLWELRRINRVAAEPEAFVAM
jgi:hypothetical protein